MCHRGCFEILFSYVIPIDWLPSNTLDEKKEQDYAYLFTQTQLNFNDAEAHNCFKMLLFFQAILRGLTMNIL